MLLLNRIIQKKQNAVKRTGANSDLKRCSAGNSIHRFSVGGGIYDAPDAPTDFV